MSGPRRCKLKLRSKGLSRRDFLKRAGAGAAAFGVLPALSACGDSSRGDLIGGGGGDGPAFVHGVASGDPLADRVILWTRLSGVSATTAVSWIVASDPGLQSVVQSGTASAQATRDYTVHADAAGLQPATTYYYRFSAGRVQSPVGRTRTLPVGSVERLRLGVLSCASLAHGLFNAYRRVAARQDLDLVVHLGDYIYEYASGEYGNARAYEPASEIRTLDDYRLRHAQYKRDTDLQELHRQHAMVAIWDDHETADNSWRDGAVNHDAATEGEWPVRVDVGLQAFYEWLPIRRVDATNPRNNARRFELGDLAELIMLEERLLAREQQIPGLVEVSGAEVLLLPVGAVEDDGRQLLGAEQEAWLQQRLQTGSARWKLLGQGVMFGQLKLAGLPELATGGVYVNPDQWDGYPAARNRVFEMLTGGEAGTPVDNAVVLTGDIHSSWCMDLTPDPNNPVPQLGGYDPLSGEGSRAVEFVVTSVTSPGLDSFQPVQPLIPLLNPHIKYSDLTRKGYLLLDITAERIVGEHWYIDTIDVESSAESFGVAFQSLSGSNRLVAATMTTPRENPPAFAP